MGLVRDVDMKVFLRGLIIASVFAAAVGAAGPVNANARAGVWVWNGAKWVFLAMAGSAATKAGGAAYDAAVAAVASHINQQHQQGRNISSDECFEIAIRSGGDAKLARKVCRE
jgi:hypothetical protein